MEGQTTCEECIGYTLGSQFFVAPNVQSSYPFEEVQLIYCDHSGYGSCFYMMAPPRYDPDGTTWHETTCHWMSARDVRPAISVPKFADVGEAETWLASFVAASA